ncbi:MAG: hypothetical protein A2161_07345 [Candidatus Schekmanbacteria bacterium RBG_13_48_7]|uniref:Bulb-type lectin domain-containing protein n=1 Tax=Candidatus Schekmanbacteria bacterium RBG_13_48_7 TaxID=1817878 RepID=A0A1F7S653_9BACT|nr:MAG: hypothetical protein A2161_07345 [Candidatus Schekmanbacteria bacterium RBG_13_48_7]
MKRLQLSVFIVFFAMTLIIVSGISSVDARITEEWISIYKGPYGYDGAKGLAMDTTGNIYVTGDSGGTGGYLDFATAKYNNDGLQLWVARYNGPVSLNDEVNDIYVDSDGNVYVTGWNTVDLRSTNTDYTTIKYDTYGTELWAATYSGSANYNDQANAVTVDSLGNVYVTGYSTEFDGTDYSTECTTIKYDCDGNQLWVAQYHQKFLFYDVPKDIVVDASGNVYVTGATGTGCSDWDYLTIKYDNYGNQLWVATYDNFGFPWTDQSNDIFVVNSGNVYITGSSYGLPGGMDFATIKYSASGVELWVARYDGPDNLEDGAEAIAVDSSENVYVTGHCQTLLGYNDYCTIKYNNAGVQQWVAKYKGPMDGDDAAKAIAVDSSGYVYVTGNSQRDASDNYDYTTIQYDTDGNQQWEIRYNGPTDAGDTVPDGNNALVIDESISPPAVYITGTDSEENYATIKYTIGEEIPLTGRVAKYLIIFLISIVFIQAHLFHLSIR